MRRASDALAAGVLLAYQLVVHGPGRASRGGRIAANLAAAATAAGIGRIAGFSARDMGVSWRDARRGAAVGTLVALPVTAAVAGAASSPRTRGLFADDRASTYDAREAAFQLLVRIPLETALAEEVLFRGVHLAITRRLHPPQVALLRTSLAFGLWHVLPAIASLRRTDAGQTLATSHPRRAAAIAGTVAVTSVAGYAFALLRLRSRSVLAPVIVHAALNATALACAYRNARDRTAAASYR